MKSISLCLAALLSAGSPLVAEDLAASPKTEQRETLKSTNLSLSKDYLNTIHSHYEHGEYQEFLEQMDQAYLRAKQDGALEGLIAIRKEEALIAKEQEKTNEKWDQLFRSWEKERNNELLKLIGNDETSVLAQKIRSVAKPLDPVFQETLSYFSQLRNLELGQGKNADENLLIEKDLELEYKKGHFSSLLATGNWTPDYREKLVALHFDFADQLLKDSKEFQDKDLQKKVNILTSALNDYYERKLNAEDLQRLTLGAIPPGTDLEEKAAAILAAYAEKFSEETRAFFQSEQTK